MKINDLIKQIHNVNNAGGKKITQHLHSHFNTTNKMRKILLLSAVLILGLAACSSDETTISVTGVTLTQSTLTLTVGETETLTAIIAPTDATNPNVTWRSNNTAVATVNAQGAVAAFSPGTAIITVTTVDGGKTTTATVTVNAAIVTVTSVTLGNDVLKLPVGGTETLTAIIAPANATNINVTWESDDEDVAKVDDDGNVTAVSEGTTTITVITEDGNFTATRDIVVYVPVTSVQIDRQTLRLAIGDSETVSAFVFPRYAMNHNVTWEIADTGIATVDATTGEVTAVAVGATTITVTSECGGFTDTIPVETVPRTTDVGVLINGITWATRNVDAPGTFAALPESAGMFYQWNRNTGWSSRNPVINSNGETAWDNSIPTGTIWYAENDPCPQGWRVPTRVELESLHNAGSTWTANWNGTGVSGRTFGTSFNQIFLPAAGSRNRSGSLGGVGTVGWYWSTASLDATLARGLWFSSTSSLVDAIVVRAGGISIRCVAE